MCSTLRCGREVDPGGRVGHMTDEARLLEAEWRAQAPALSSVPHADGIPCEVRCDSRCTKQGRGSHTQKHNLKPWQKGKVKQVQHQGRGGRGICDWKQGQPPHRNVESPGTRRAPGRLRLLQQGASGEPWNSRPTLTHPNPPLLSLPLGPHHPLVFDVPAICL